jgi:hypothetical protein
LTICRVGTEARRLYGTDRNRDDCEVNGSDEGEQFDINLAGANLGDFYDNWDFGLFIEGSSF